MASWVQIRVGLHSGAVVVRAIEQPAHGLHGGGPDDPPGARMEQMATPGSVLTTGETLRLAEGLVQVKPLGPVSVKGLADPVEVFELVAPSLPGRVCRCWRRVGSPASSGGRRSSRPCARPWSALAPATARSWR